MDNRQSNQGSAPEILNQQPVFVPATPEQTEQPTEPRIPAPQHRMVTADGSGFSTD